MRSVLAVLMICALAPAGLAQGVQMAPTGPETARAIDAVVAAANRSFPRLPAVRLTTQIRAVCGGGDASDLARYCTSQNTIFVAHDLAPRLGPEAAAYVVAHMFGHGIQVRHGVADVALRTIRAEPQNEPALRGMVTRQVECLAGVLLARAGAGRPDLAALFDGEPFTDSHWGHEPVSRGPRVSIGLAPRQDWLDRGYGENDIAACTVERISAEGLVAAER